MTGSTGDVNKSVDIFTALNNAIIAGGASAETQSSAMEQFSQSFSKGKPDMSEWRSLLTAMPAQLSQVATKMGLVDTDALGEGLRDGSISMSDFSDALIEMDETGLDGFPSLAEQAKNASGGIQTSMANMKTAVGRGIANMIGTIDEGLQKNGFPTFGEAINNSAEGIDRAFSGIGKVAGNFFDHIKEWSKSEAGKLFAEKITALKDSFKGFDGVKVASKILEKLFDIIAGVGTTVMTIIQGLKDGFEKFAKSPAGKMLGDAFKSIGDNIHSLVGEGPGFENFLNGLKAVYSVVAQGIGYAILGIVKAIEGITFAVKKIDEFFKNVVIPAIVIIVIKVKDAVGKIKGFFTALGSNIKTIVDKITGFWKALPGKIVSFVSGIANKVTSFFKSIPGTISGYINKVVELWKALPGKIINALGSLGEKIKTFFSKVPGWIQSGIGNLASIGKNLLEGIWSGIQNVKNWLIGKLKGLGGTIVDAIKNAFGIASPSKVMRDEIGKNLMLGIAGGITGNLKVVDDAIGKVKSDMLSGFSVAARVNSYTDGINDGAAPSEYRQIVINQVVKPSNTLLDIYNNTKFGVRTAVSV